MALTGGIGLVPRSEDAGVGVIEITDRGVALDGQAVTGQELESRLGADGELVIQLTYLSPTERRQLLGLDSAPADETPTVQGPGADPRPRSSTTRQDGRTTDRDGRRRRRNDRVRIFRNVAVQRDETVRGDVVAVMGSARIDGEVQGDVVAVLGSVHLGPGAQVDGDVVTVGGELHRDEEAGVGGDVTEVALGSIGNLEGVRDAPWAARWLFTPLEGFGKLAATLIRIALLALIASLVVLVAGRPVSRIAGRVQTEPLKAGLIGFAAEVLFVPVLVITCVVLAVSVIGIPLLILVPFAIVALLLVMLAGFSGVACAVGEWAAKRFGLVARSQFAFVWLGVAALLVPLVTARLLGLAGGFFGMMAMTLVGVGLVLEYAAWTAGLGAALMGVWNGRRPPDTSPSGSSVDAPPAALPS